VNNLGQALIDVGAPIRFFNVTSDQARESVHLTVTGETGVALEILPGGDTEAVIENAGLGRVSELVEI